MPSDLSDQHQWVVVVAAAATTEEEGISELLNREKQKSGHFRHFLFLFLLYLGFFFCLLV
jgi:hypothetical protein